MAEKKTATLSQELNGWGGGLIFMGILHFFIPALAAPWGIALIILGSLAFMIKHRGMFIALGCALCAIGLLNLVGSLAEGKTFWGAFGCFQVYWGIKEITKFKKYGRVQEAEMLNDGVATENPAS